jgi:hypothetical protein
MSLVAMLVIQGQLSVRYRTVSRIFGFPPDEVEPAELPPDTPGLTMHDALAPWR